MFLTLTTVFVFNAIMGSQAALLATTRLEAPASNQPENVTSEGEYLLRGMQNARLQLRSGVCRMTGSRSSFRTTEGAPRTLSVSTSALYAFDSPTGRLRYDHLHPEHIGFMSGKSPPAIDAPPPPKFLLTQKLNSVRTPDLFAWYEGTGPHGRIDQEVSTTAVTIEEPTAEWSGGVAEAHNLVDIRSLGILSYLEYTGRPRLMGRQKQTGFSELATCTEVIEDFLNWEVTEIERASELTTIHFNRLSITLNEVAGFTPVSYSMAGGGDGDTLNSQVVWEEVNGVYVPTKFTIEHVGWPRPSDFVRHEMTLAWSHVNENVPDQYFDFRNFPDVADGTRVVDSRGGRHVRIAMWENGKFTEIIQKPPNRPIGTPVTWSPFAYLNLMGLAMLVAYWIWRRFAQQ